MKKNINIPIFQYAYNQNKIVITEQSLKQAIGSFVNKPVFIYNSDDNHNKENQITGIISKVNSYEEPFVYGDILTFNDETIKNFRNYSIQLKEMHTEDNITIVDRFVLMDVSFDVN